VINGLSSVSFTSYICITLYYCEFE